MGSVQTTEILRNDNTWKEIEPSRTEIVGNPAIHEELITHVEADAYTVFLNENLNYQVQQILRHQQISHVNVLKLIDAKRRINGPLQCGGKEILFIYTEKIVCRFNQLNLSQLQNIFVLRESLRGFSNLNAHSGNYFKVKESMIGFDESGCVKVWLNDNFGLQQIGQQSLLRNQHEMVKSLLDIFASKLMINYKHLEATSFAKLGTLVQQTLKNINLMQIMMEIREQIKIIQLPFNNSEKSISNISNSQKGNKQIARHIKNRPSIQDQVNYTNFNSSNNQIILTRPNNLKHKFSLKENQPEIIQSNFPVKQIAHVKQPRLNIAQLIPKSVNNFPQPLSSNPYPKPFQEQIINFNHQPCIKINYHCPVINQLDKGQINFVQFPNQSLDPVLNTNRSQNIRPSLLRQPNRQFSNIIERSEQGDTLSKESMSFVQESPFVSEQYKTDKELEQIRYKSKMTSIRSINSREIIMSKLQLQY